MKINNCLRCQTPLHHTITIRQLFSFKKIKFSALCSSCQKAFQKASDGKRCMYCQHPLKTEDKICFDCQEWLKKYCEKFMVHLSMYDYNVAFQDWITDYKYRGDCRQALVMSEVLRKQYLRHRAFIWTYLPSSPVSYSKRQFNQIQYLLQVSGIPYLEIFDYVGDTSPQAKKNKKDRLAFMQSFAIKKELVLPDKILILDDVYTTGATLMRAKECLFSAGVSEVKSLTLARDVMK